MPTKKYEETLPGVVYRVGKIEDLISKHDERIRLMENYVLTSSQGDFFAKLIKYGLVVLTGIGTLVGVVYSIIK